MKVSSVHPNLIDFVSSSLALLFLFILSFTFPFHIFYTSESLPFLILYFFPAFVHMLSENPVSFHPQQYFFFPSSFSLGISKHPSELLSYRATVAAHKQFQSTLIFKILIISEVFPITWWTSALERIRPQPSILRTEKPIIEKNVPFVEE